MNNVKKFKKYCQGMNVIPPSPPFPTHIAQLLSTTLYIYFVENQGALKINNYFKIFIFIYDSKFFEES
jgi:hypothetical protein